MTDEFSTPLATIETALQRLDRQALLRSLQAGLSAEDVRSSIGAVALPSSPVLEALYGWRNGTSTTGDVTLDDIHILPGFYLLSIEDAIASYRAFVTDSRWRPGWLPLFANGGGDFYVLDLSSPAASPIRHSGLRNPSIPLSSNRSGRCLRHSLLPSSEASTSSKTLRAYDSGVMRGEGFAVIRALTVPLLWCYL